MDKSIMSEYLYEQLIDVITINATRRGFTKEDLGNFSLDKFSNIKNEEILKLIELAYLRGCAFGIREARNAINCRIAALII